MKPNDKTKLISFFLPQFHPVPENDQWWGKGFTEWTNVTKATPSFPGHYQPHRPSDLGFYDLRLAETRHAQAELAQEYGIHGFCYYHYWFNGRRILERPFNDILKSKKPALPFCLCWANENWTRTWDGGEDHILLKQNYNDKDDIAHFTSLIPALKDDRYIRINDKPLFIVYRTGLLPDPKRSAQIWREIAHKEGIGDIYLARIESFSDYTSPESMGFDAAIEFAPNYQNSGVHPFENAVYTKFSQYHLFPKGLTNRTILDYDEVVKKMLNRVTPEDFKRFRCVFPHWDNSARKAAGGMAVVNSTPEKYQYWLEKMLYQTQKKYSGDENIVFINAWNEWAEGCHLEPDQKWGHDYLSATRDALNNCVNNIHTESPLRPTPPLSRPIIYLNSISRSLYDRNIGWRFNKNTKN